MRLLPLLATFGALAALSATPVVAAPAKGHAAAKPAAASATGPAAPAAIAGFDARDPDSIIAMLKQMNAEGKIVKTTGDQVLVAITAPSVSFGAQLLGCDAKGKACHAMILSAGSEKPVTLLQINVFNRAQPACRALQTADGKISLTYFALVTPRAATEDIRQQMAVWSGCIANFSEFLKDPAAFPPKPAPKPAG